MALTYKASVNVKSEIAVAELANKAVRVASDLVTAAKYKVAENVAWGTYYVTVIAAEVKYLASYIKTETTFATAKKEADEAFDLAVIPAWVNYEMDLRAWETCFIAAVAHCADLNFVAANWFNNGTNTVAGDFTFVTLRTTGEGDGTQGGGAQNTDDVMGMQMIVDLKNAPLLNGAVGVAIVNDPQQFARPTGWINEILEQEKVRIHQELDKKLEEGLQKLDPVYYATLKEWEDYLSPVETIDDVISSVISRCKLEGLFTIVGEELYYHGHLRNVYETMDKKLTDQANAMIKMGISESAAAEANPFVNNLGSQGNLKKNLFLRCLKAKNYISQHTQIPKQLMPFDL